MLFPIFSLIILCYSTVGSCAPAASDIRNSTRSFSYASQTITSAARLPSGTGSTNWVSYYRSLYDEAESKEKNSHISIDFAPFRASACFANSSLWNSQHLTMLETRSVTQPYYRLTNEDVGIPFSEYSYTTYTNLDPEQWGDGAVNPMRCCDKCRLRWNYVEVKYWPQTGANTECLADIVSTDYDIKSIAMEMDEGMGLARSVIWSPGASESFYAKAQGLTYVEPTPTITSAYLNSQGEEVEEDEFDGTLVIDDRTYISPSIYIDVPTIAAVDRCGDRGPMFVPFRTSFAPEQMSSVVPNDLNCWGPYFNSIRDIGRPGEPVPTSCTWATKAFNFDDLPCPPQSLRDENHNSWYYNSKIAYAPILAPMSEIQALRPEWEGCEMLFGWDPFTTLIPFNTLLPNPRPGTSRKPKPSIVNSDPEPTISASIKNPNPQPGASSSDIRPTQTQSPTVGTKPSSGDKPTEDAAAQYSNADGSQYAPILQASSGVPSSSSGKYQGDSQVAKTGDPEQSQSLKLEQSQAPGPGHLHDSDPNKPPSSGREHSQESDPKHSTGEATLPSNLQNPYGAQNQAIDQEAGTYPTNDSPTSGHQVLPIFTTPSYPAGGVEGQSHGKHQSQVYASHSTKGAHGAYIYSNEVSELAGHVPTGILIGTQTLGLGETATIAGTKISLETNGDLVQGSKTIVINPTHTTGKIGNQVWFALGGKTTSEAESKPGHSIFAPEPTTTVGPKASKGVELVPSDVPVSSGDVGSGDPGSNGTGNGSNGTYAGTNDSNETAVVLTGASQKTSLDWNLVVGLTALCIILRT